MARPMRSPHPSFSELMRFPPFANAVPSFVFVLSFRFSLKVQRCCGVIANSKILLDSGKSNILATIHKDIKNSALKNFALFKTEFYNLLLSSYGGTIPQKEGLFNTIGY